MRRLLPQLPWRVPRDHQSFAKARPGPAVTVLSRSHMSNLIQIKRLYKSIYARVYGRSMRFYSVLLSRAHSFAFIYAATSATICNFGVVAKQSEGLKACALN